MCIGSARRVIPALVAVLLLVGCITPFGGPVVECGEDWQPTTVEGGTVVTGNLETLPIECYRVTGERRLEVGILMPPGPDCYAVDYVEVIEDGEAVSLEVRIGTVANPLGGACPPESFSWGVPVELNGPVEGRRILDASNVGG
ncbi:MAG TPA: hypothetical protein VLA76_05270 [Candidatus Angelobacter sp.]|nr:hypothetical protein [Candidatus Angelobacter sp.]